MRQIRTTVSELHRMDELSERKLWINQMHPLLKLVVTVLYLFTVTSFHRYDVFGVLSMFVYLFVLFQIADVSFAQCWKRIRFVLPVILFLSFTNPLFDKNQILLGGHILSAGWISMVVLWIKGMYCVAAGYLLIATTNMESICYALQCLHVPNILITQLLLTYRYISLLLVQVHRLSQAYALRAPKQKGIQYKAWGSFAGQLLLRSIDRANDVFDSMTLRGYRGSFHYMKNKSRPIVKDLWYVLVWALVFYVLRHYPVLIWIGSIFGR